MDSMHKTLICIVIFLFTALAGIIHSAFTPYFTYRFPFIGSEVRIQLYDMKEDNRVFKILIKYIKELKDTYDNRGNK